jgi:hypothetical protein
VLEVDHEKLELDPGNLLILDSGDLADKLLGENCNCSDMRPSLVLHPNAERRTARRTRSAATHAASNVGLTSARGAIPAENGMKKTSAPRRTGFRSTRSNSGKSVPQNRAKIKSGDGRAAVGGPSNCLNHGIV